MKRRLLLSAAYVFVLLAMSTVPFAVRPAKAGASIIIRADGSIEGTNSITTLDNVTYVFTADINGSVTIERDNIVLDGWGYKLLATSGEQTGVSLAGRTNVTIQAVDVQGFYYGILLQSSCSCNNVVNDNMKGNKYGVLVNSSPNNTISNITVTESSDTGIKLVSCSQTSILGNNLTHNKIGISLQASHGCILKNNVMNDNDYSLDVYGLWGISNYVQDIDTSNTCNGKAVQYMLNQHSLIVNPSTFPEIGYLAIVNSTDIIIENLNFSKSVEGILLAGVTNVNVTQNNVTDNDHGLLIYNCSNIRVMGNRLTNRAYSVRLVGCLGSYISDNNVTGTIDAISVEGCSNSSILRNRIMTSGFWALWLSGTTLINVTQNVIANGANGIRLESAYNNGIFENNVTGNGIGISFENNPHVPYSKGSDDNSCYGNNITGNHVGIGFSQSSNNSIWHNNVVSNIQQVSGDNSSNIWDKGYSFGGNYWSNYAGLDENHDGIGDIAYVINGNNTDKYPLIAPHVLSINYETFCAGTWGAATYYISLASNSTISDFSFDENLKQIDFNVTGDSPTIGFCRIEIPNELLDGDYTVYVDSTPVVPIVTSNGTHSFLYFMYTHSNHRIQIIGTTAIPEYSLPTIMAVLALITISSVLAQRKRKTADARDIA